MKNLLSYSLLACILILTACGGNKTDDPAPQNMSEGAEMPDERLYFDLDTSSLDEVSAGDTLQATLLTGDTYDLVVFRVDETLPGLIAIAANVDGDMEIGQASLIFRNNELRGSVDMHRMGMKYQVYFDKEKEQHYLLPRTDEDVLQGSEPLTAPADKLEQD